MSLDVGLYVGSWSNTAGASGRIRHVEFVADEGFAIRCASAEGDWGSAAATPLSDGTDLTVGRYFCASPSGPVGDVVMHGWVKLGVLVIAHFDAGRGVFDRDFFHRA